MPAQVRKLSSCQCVMPVTSRSAADSSRDKDSEKTPQASAVVKEVPQL